MLNVTKHFLNYLKEIDISDFSFMSGFSCFIGYKINEYLKSFFVLYRKFSNYSRFPTRGNKLKKDWMR